MKKYEVSTNIPIPPDDYEERKLRNPLRQAVAKMKHGHSIEVKDIGAAGRAATYMREAGFKGRMRKQPDGKYRVWLIDSKQAKKGK
jgi:hypothetical protein